MYTRYPQKDKMYITGNSIVLPIGKGKDEYILEKALFLLKGIFAEKIGKGEK